MHHTSGSDSSSYESDPKNSSSNQLVPKISTISSNYKFAPTVTEKGATGTATTASDGEIMMKAKPVKCLNLT